MKTRLKRLISQKPLHWTEHAKFKTRQYGLSEARVKRVLRNPTRIEAGIAPKTVAVMQPANPRHSEELKATKNLSRMRDSRSRAGSFASLRMTKRGEIWVMYQDTPKARKIIVAWRYPGVSPVREPPPFPEDLMA